MFLYLLNTDINMNPVEQSQQDIILMFFEWKLLLVYVHKSRKRSQN